MQWASLRSPPREYSFGRIDVRLVAGLPIRTPATTTRVSTILGSASTSRSRCSRGPGRVSAQAMLLGRRNVSFRAVGKFQIERAVERTLLFQLEARDPVDLVGHCGDAQDHRSAPPAGRLRSRVLVNPLQPAARKPPDDLREARSPRFSLSGLAQASRAASGTRRRSFNPLFGHRDRKFRSMFDLSSMPQELFRRSLWRIALRSIRFAESCHSSSSADRRWFPGT